MDVTASSIFIRVIGEPKAQPRPRAFARKLIVRGREIVTARVYDSASAECWKSDVAAAARDQRPDTPLEGPLRVDLTFLFPRTKDDLRPARPDERMPHVKRPDLDNLFKAVADCLTLLGFWSDDSQVCRCDLDKWIVARGELPGCEIRIDASISDDSGGLFSAREDWL